MNGKAPTQKQLLVLKEYARREQKRLPPPSIRELCELLGVRSTNGVAAHIQYIAKKGLMEPTSPGQKARSWRLTKAGREAVGYRSRLDKLEKLYADITEHYAGGNIPEWLYQNIRSLEDPL